MENSLKPAEHTKTYLWLAASYFVTVGLLYLWAYWSSFGINILEYATLSDVAKVAIIPVGSAFVFILLGFLLSEVSFAPYFPSGEGKGTRTGRFLMKFRTVFALLYWVILILLIFTPLPNKWRVLPIWGMWVPYFVLKNANFLSEIKNDSVRSLMIAGLSVLPIFSFCQGKLDANKILTNSEYFYVQSSSEERMKYIGYVNELTFLVSQDNQLIRIQRLDKQSSLDLLKFNVKGSKPNKSLKEDEAKDRRAP